MNDYGHDLLFGSFATPLAQPAQRGVELALVSERAGLDLVTFQDHPYQTSFHDTSTLLTHVASRTRTIAVSGSVTSLPLRPPLGLARMAATVDQLSGGRFRLGIGAGAFWDGVARMGGRRLSTGQSVSALREAIGLIRDAWDPAQPWPLHHDGEYYRAEGAHRAPYAHHRIPIWVGAYKPRMLGLTGAVSDGWLPSIEYVEGGLSGLADANKRIDDAAQEAGREPAAVRRLLNVMNVSLTPTGRGFLDGPPKLWIDRLTTLALDYGISAFMIGGDDPVTLTRFGTEIAPAVRENVTQARR
ncbi:LLM class flavin-dependent oxidoreductase [Actinoplanes sp. NPDC048796]|uniref:LLM class flavin-dependent oxidoreductase n=1 Tax=unclassified Actinoplanes TaxID=2626549 RepID=UPI0033E9BE12